MRIHTSMTLELDDGTEVDVDIHANIRKDGETWNEWIAEDIEVIDENGFTLPDLSTTESAKVDKQIEMCVSET